MKYFLIAITFFACNNISNQMDLATISINPKISAEKLDTIESLPTKIEAKPVLFETAFIKGTKEKVDSLNVHFYGVTIGEIKIVSGYIIACDPIIISDAKPFTQSFPLGKFPVQLSIAKIEDDERIAFARINFSDEPVARWEFALQKGQAPIPIGGETIYGYGVDAGIGLFIDEEANKVLDNMKISLFDGKFYKEMDKHYHNTWQYVVFNFGEHNLASFSTGYGDGHYATYIGFDAKGKPCRLVTDFGLVDWWRK
jgi:hypothetical protein